MLGSVRPDTQPYFDLIGTTLKARGDAKDDFDLDLEFGEPRYVIRMCQKMLARIGRADLTVQDVLRKERCASGHTDYQRKFALYCREIELGHQP